MVISAYIDDLFTIDDTFIGCFGNVEKIVSFFTSLGFVVHPEKSCFLPTQTLEYLGVVIDSLNMTVSLTHKKREKIFKLCQKLLTQDKCQIRDIAKLLGYMSYGLIAVKFGKMHYRQLERVNIKALALSKGNFEAFTKLSPSSKDDITWWKDNMFNSYNDIFKGSPEAVLTTDASLTGWGAVTEAQSCGGLFSEEESSGVHINILELKAVLFGLKSLLSYTTNCHIKVL